MLFDPQRLLLIAGPCSLENETVCRTVATELAVVRGGCALGRAERLTRFSAP